MSDNYLWLALFEDSNLVRWLAPVQQISQIAPKFPSHKIISMKVVLQEREIYL